MEKAKERCSRVGPGYLEIIVITMMITGAAITFYDRYLTQKIHVLDLQGYLRTQKSLLAAGEISTEEWQTSLDSIERAVNGVAENPNHIILLKDVVLKNGIEIDIKE